jgi:signal transduction histidine kinase/CheY-like chemotaxis protein
VIGSNRDKVPYDIEYRAVWPDGSIHWIAAKGQSYFNEEGKAVRMHGIVLDIDEHKRAEERLRASEQRLQRWNVQLEKAVNAKTADLKQSQERLRALATELNLAEQRERKRLAAELHDHLQQILVLGKLKLGQGKRYAESVPQCAQVIRQTDDVLSEALKYTRTLVAELSPPVLHDHGLSAGLKWLAESMKKLDLVVAVSVPDNNGLKLPEDQTVLLFQSVRELLVNSLKHAGTYEASITLEVCDGQLTVEVKDLGAGFDVAAVADGQISSEASGGISSKFGLFSIRERMKALGGTFGIQSAPGEGTTATLKLPLSVSTQSTFLQSTYDGLPHHLAGSASILQSPRIRVLLVDDHAMVRQGLRSILASNPIIEIVAEAADGVEALCCVEQHRPAVVVMDINMPNMNGIEATARLTARYPEIHVIGLSVNAGGENQEAMRRAGATMLLTKEAAVEHLYEAIQSAMKSQIADNTVKTLAMEVSP